MNVFLLAAVCGWWSCGPHLVVVLPVQAVGGRVGAVVRLLHEHRLVLHGDPLLVHAHHLTHGGRLAHGQEKGLARAQRTNA